MGIRTSIIAMLALVLTFILGTWLGSLIMPGSSSLAGVIGGVLLGGGILYLTRNIGR